jgi:hypothetical protein
MTTPAHWITDRPPTEADADSEQNVIVSTHIDNNLYNRAYMNWSRAAQGYLPWRHTILWVPPEPEPPAPVIVTPEPEPEPKPEPQLREDYTTCLNCYVVYKSSKSRCPNCGYGFVPEPEPEKAARGFLAFTRTEYEDSIVYTAVATDHTAWVFDAINTTNWRQILPLPQPGEE